MQEAAPGTEVSSKETEREPGEELVEEQAEEEAIDNDEIVDETPKPVPATPKESLDPRKQSALRQKIRSEMKQRGRNAAAKKCAEDDDSENDDGETKPRRSRAKPKASPKKKAEKAEKTKPKAKAKAATKAKAKAKAGAKAEPKKRGRRPTKVRVPPVAEDGTELSLGCSTCRFSEIGCGTCEKADFKGKRRSDVSPETIRRAQQSLKGKAEK